MWKALAACGAALTLAACMGGPQLPEGFSEHSNVKIEATGLYVVTPTGVTVGLGQAGVDIGTTVATYPEGATPLQASYRTYENGQMTLEVIDGTTNCTGLNMEGSVDVADIDAELLKTFCMGLGAQDLAIGLAE